MATLNGGCRYWYGVDDWLTLTPKAPAIAGAFYFFISSNNRPYRPSIPGTIRVLKELASWVQYSIIHIKKSGNISSLSLFVASKDMFIFSLNHHSLRIWSPSRIPFARLNLTATWCQSSGIWFRRMSNAKGNFCWPGETRFFLLWLLLPFSTRRFSILEPQWHLEPPLLLCR